MASKSEVKDVDKGYKKFVENMRRHEKGPHVRVGIQGQGNQSPREEFGISNVRLAAVHEFGSRDGRIPQRSFIRATIDRERKLLDKMLERAVRNAAEHGDHRKELEIVGQKAVAEMVRTIDQSIGLKPLSTQTIARKGSSRPLIDTGQLKRSITYKVYDK